MARSIYEKEDVPMLINDMPVRWNSTLLMFERARSLKGAINEYCTSDRKLRQYQLAQSEWDLIDRFIKYLQPFREASELLSGSKFSTIIEVVPLFRYTTNKMERFIVEDNSGFAQSLATNLRHYQNAYMVEEIYTVSAFLDPRQKTHAVSNDQDEFLESFEVLARRYEGHRFNTEQDRSVFFYNRSCYFSLSLT